MPMLPPKQNLNIAVAKGGFPDFERQGARTIATQLKGSKESFGEAMTPAKIGLPPPTLPPLPGSPATLPTMTSLQTSTADVLRTASALAGEDRAQGLTPPPLVMVPVPVVSDGLGAPQGSGVPEYNVSTPYGSGPGVNDKAVTPVKRDDSGRPVLTIKTPPGQKSQSWLLWAGLAAAAAYFL